MLFHYTLRDGFETRQPLRDLLLANKNGAHQNVDLKLSRTAFISVFFSSLYLSKLRFCYSKWVNGCLGMQRFMCWSFNMSHAHKSTAHRQWNTKNGHVFRHGMDASLNAHWRTGCTLCTCGGIGPRAHILVSTWSNEGQKLLTIRLAGMQLLVNASR